MQRDIPRFLKIEDGANLIRDTHSMGVLNTNRTALQAAKIRRTMVLQQKTQEQQHKMEINSLRGELAEVKALLLKLLEKE